jgi:HSP20 family molecular chaperone IbpA
MRNTNTPFGPGFPFGGDFFETVFGRDAWKDFNQMFQTFGTVSSFPPHNIYALKDGSARIDLALAGYAQSDISLRAEDGKLVVEGKGHDDEACDCGPSCDCGDDCECVYHGIKSSSFKKSISMPTKFDLSQAKAKMKDGMLSITVPLAEERKPRDIKVDITNE